MASHTSCRNIGAVPAVVVVVAAVVVAAAVAAHDTEKEVSPEGWKVFSDNISGLSQRFFFKLGRDVIVAQWLEMLPEDWMGMGSILAPASSPKYQLIFNEQFYWLHNCLLRPILLYIRENHLQAQPLSKTSTANPKALSPQ